MPKQIMLLESEEEIRTVLTQHLQKAGYTVICPVDCYVGLECAENCSFDLVLLNYQMPIITGRRFLETLRNTGFQAPAIVFSQVSTDSEPLNFESLTPCILIQKPFQIDTLLEKIAHLINN